MIANLRGTIIEKGSDHITIEVGGVGLQVYVPDPFLDSLVTGDRIFLQICLVVRENSLTLFGFETREEREFYELLLGVSGIGPRLALSALSTLNPEAIRRAVFHEQPEVFSRVPGVGRKTAQKMMLHLQGRITMGDDFAQVVTMTDVDTQVLEALTGLGYSIVEAQAALQSIPRDTPQDVETRIRLALQYFT